MAHDRRRAREDRQAARRHEVATAAARRERQARRNAVRGRLVPTPKRRRRRYGALTTLQRAQLVLAFLLVQGVMWLLTGDVALRFVVAVLTVACLAVAVRTRRRPKR